MYELCSKIYYIPKHNINKQCDIYKNIYSLNYVKYLIAFLIYLTGFPTASPAIGTILTADKNPSIYSCLKTLITILAISAIQPTGGNKPAAFKTSCNTFAAVFIEDAFVSPILLLFTTLVTYSFGKTVGNCVGNCDINGFTVDCCTFEN